METNDNEFLAALNGIQAETTGVSALTAFDKSKACEIYNRIKPFLNTVLPFIERIPVFGRKVADAIRLLMQIADQVCA